MICYINIFTLIVTKLVIDYLVIQRSELRAKVVYILIKFDILSVEYQYDNYEISTGKADMSYGSIRCQFTERVDSLSDWVSYNY